MEQDYNRTVSLSLSILQKDESLGYVGMIEKLNTKLRRAEVAPQSSRRGQEQRIVAVGIPLNINKSII